MNQLQGRTALITGAANGLGWEIANRFADAGANVVLTDRNESLLHDRAKQLRGRGKDVLALVCDVQDESEIEQTVQQTVERFGRLDILLNNAGMQHVSPVETFPTKTFETMIDVMLTGPFRLTKAVLPMMKQQQYGRIINMASINGLIGYAGKSAYNSAKHGLVGLTKVTALECAAEGITVNAFALGMFEPDLVQKQLDDLASEMNVSEEEVLEKKFYPLIPQQRLLQPKEIAHYALFLADEASQGITGQTNVMDGGYT
ncbi:LOW QUALITY PROTEIN: D-beta-hydroxybutyrate dehydrogenase [Geomicrobium sp. JCM 19037]|nr:LOW QUALITY PROTEIN: D-beta-hydroxybutyrate dehydrogenase [Geomicrobium sp. JCM 19037]